MDELPKKKIERFPRLTTAANALAYAQLLWADPEVKIVFDKNISATQFIFTIPISPAFKKSYDVEYQTIFKHFDWEEAVRDSYQKSRYGRKPVSTHIFDGIHKTLIDALKKWRHKVRDLARETPKDTKEKLDELLLGEFREGPKRKSGPQPDPHVALRAVKRARALLPKIAVLRRTFKARDHRATAKDLLKATESVATWDIVQRALKSLLADQGSITPLHIFTPALSNHQIAYAIVQGELEQKGHEFKKISFRTYLRHGRKLLKQLE